MSFLFLTAFFMVLGRWQPYVLHLEFHGSIEFSPDGGRAVVVETIDRAQVWDLQARREQFSIRDEDVSIQETMWSPDGRLIATLHHAHHWDEMGDQSPWIARLWDARTGGLVREFVLESESLGRDVYTRSFLSAGGGRLYVCCKVLARGGTDRTCAWDVGTGERLFVVDGETREDLLSPTGDLLVVLEEAIAKVVGAETGSELWQAPARAADFSSDGELLLVDYTGGQVVEYDARIGKKASRFPDTGVGSLRRQSRSSRSVSVHNDSRRVDVHDGRTGEVLASFHWREHGEVTVIDWLRAAGLGEGLDESCPDPRWAFLSPGGRYLVLENDSCMIYRRRRPEWWWGHFCRPEVWVAVVFASLWLWRVARWARRRLGGESAS